MTTSHLHRYSIVLIAATSCSTPSPGYAQEAVLLRYQFQPGQVVRYSVEMHDDHHIVAGEDQEHISSRQSSIKSYRVLAVDAEGNALLELTLLEQVRAEISHDGAVHRFDSSQLDQPVAPEFMEMKEMVGKPHMRIAVRPTGEVTGALVLAGKVEPKENGAVRPANAVDKPEADEGTNASKQAAMDVFLRLPEEPIAVGERWQEYFHVPIHIPPSLTKNVRMQRVHTLRRLEEGQAVIDIETKVLTPIGVPEQEVQLILRTPKETVTVDLNRGLIVAKERRLDNTVAGLSEGRAAVSATQNHREQLLEVVVEQGPPDPAAER